MDLNMIAGPLVGAVIGYFTNSIAVKMLFRPLHPVKIGNFTLPFTPGLIPKGQGRLAKAVGNTVSEQLLTEEMLSEQLLSDSMKDKITGEVENFLQNQTENTNSLHEVMREYVTMEKIEEKKDAIEEVIVDKIEYYLNTADIGRIVASEVIKEVNQHVKGTLLALMVSDELLTPIAKKIEERVNDYIANDGMLFIASAINMEADQLLNQSISVYGEKLYEEREILKKLAISTYESFIKSKMHDIICQLDIQQLVENKINEMDAAEVEKLVLSIMKKELNAVVNLGAVIGFVIGIINVFI
ncbi:MAG: DUF445 family protein [Lachnospiraceae bacterium]|nr:DUF445 family protein [Lachnospiraceae bacterium]